MAFLEVPATTTQFSAGKSGAICTNEELDQFAAYLKTKKEKLYISTKEAAFNG